MWTNVLQQLKKDLSETTITTWFDELTAVDIRENTFYLHCPNDFKKRYIESLFIKNIKAALQDLFSMEFEVKILDEAGLLEFQGGAPKKNSDRFTYEDFTFETFVVGPSNKLAYAASMAVAEHPAQNYNPLLIYGDSGLGKTHLLYAIANVIRQNDPAAKIVYIKGDDFINEFIELIRAGRGSDFRAKYREADLLLVDDVQFISGKEKTVEEFLHTFDALFHAHKTIVLCADAAACDISNLDVRLAARLESGLTVELTLPGDEDRLEILRSKRDRAGMNVSDEILEFLASRIQKSVRRLEGALLRVATFTSLSGDMPDISKIEQLLRDILREETSRVLSVETIQKRVADFYELKVSDLTGKRRPNSIAFPRQIAMYLSRRLTECSLKDIGNAFGGRDHGTVIHANKLVASRMENDVRVRDIVLRLEEDLQG